jgi:hypothetical protein
MNPLLSHRNPAAKTDPEFQAAASSWICALTPLAIMHTADIDSRIDLSARIHTTLRESTTL